MGRRVCGACGAKNQLSAVVCSECGAALKRKHRPPLRPTRRGGQQGGALYVLLDLFPGLTRLPVGVTAGVTLAAAAVLGYLTIRFLQADFLPPIFLTGLLAMICYFTSLVWLLYGYVVIPTEALVAFDGKRWLTLIALTVVPIAFIAGLLPGG